VISPGEMMDVLHAPYPEPYKAYLRRASLDMLRDLYRENPDHPKVREAQLAMETAISEWSDEQVADFLLNLFLSHHTQRNFSQNLHRSYARFLLTFTTIFFSICFSLGDVPLFFR
jgi:hypothetical protein